MRTGRWSKTGRVALLAATVLALAGATMTAAAAAVDPIGPAPAPTATWIVTLVDNADAAHEAPQLAHGEGGQVVAVYSHALDGFAFSGSAAAAVIVAPASARTVAASSATRPVFDHRPVRIGPLHVRRRARPVIGTSTHT